MRWRYMILGAVASYFVALVVHLWPPIPEFQINAGDERQFLGEDLTSRQLLFLFFDSKSDQPPVIERRSAVTGETVSSQSLEWSAMKGWDHVNHYAEISEDCSTLLWSQRKSQSLASTEEFVGTFFDSTTGRQRGTTFGYNHRGTSGLSSDGLWFWSTQQNPDCRLVIRETQNGQTLTEIPSPTGKEEIIRFYFAPDGQHGILQWLTDARILTEPSRTLHLLNLNSRRIERTFLLPEKHELRGWRKNKLGTQRSHSTTSKVDEIYQYWHLFDGQTLGLGDRDLLMDRFFDSTRALQSVCDDIEAGVAQFVQIPFELPEWSQQLSKVERFIGRNLVDRGNMRTYRGWVRIVDRSTKQVFFEQKVPISPFHCRILLGGKLLLVPGDRSWPITDVYRTDGWPRWIWTIIGGGVVFMAFGSLARWRQMAIRRKHTVRSANSI